MATVGTSLNSSHARYDRRDTVEPRRGERGLPEDLGVVVGVDVYESRCDDALARVELAVAGQVVADFGDAPIGN